MVVLLKIIAEKLLVSYLVSKLTKGVAKAVGAVYVPPSEVEQLSEILSDAVSAVDGEAQKKACSSIEECLSVPVSIRK